MRDNWNLVVNGLNVSLVPYREQFVKKYNKWMQDPELLSSTASECLTLEEEKQMQLSWKEDENSMA